MRRAVQYAIDRTALAKIDGLPATRLGSPKSPGYNDTPLYPLRPDVRTARRLSRRAQGERRASWRSTRPEIRMPAAFVQDRAGASSHAIGITVKVLPLTNRDFANGGAGVQAKALRSDLGWGGINAHTADPVDYLQQLYLPPKEWK